MVVALQANYLEVELDVAPDGCPGRLLCTRRTRLSHRGEAVYVGDRVRVEAIDPGQGRAVVAEVEPRHSFLTRPPVANVSLVAVVLAVEQPSFDPDQASRFLLTAERTGLEVILLLTKTDLISPAALERLSLGCRGGAMTRWRCPVQPEWALMLYGSIWLVRSSRCCVGLLGWARAAC